MHKFVTPTCKYFKIPIGLPPHSLIWTLPLNFWLLAVDLWPGHRHILKVIYCGFLFKNEKIFDRRTSYVIHETLTYKIVIERIVKRFLLYYKHKHSGLDEDKDGFEFKEIKNDYFS